MKHKSAIFSVFFKTMRKSRVTTILMFSAIAASVVLSLLPPLVLETIIDLLTARQAVPFLLALLYFLLLLMSGICDSAREGLITVFGQKITHGLRSTMSSRLSHLPASYFTANDPGAIVSRFTNDVDTVEDLFTSGIISMFADACQLIGIFVVIFIKSPGLGILLVIVTPLLFWMTRVFQKQMLSAQLKNRAAVARVSAHLPETIRCIRMIHVFHKERWMSDRYDQSINDSYQAVETSNFCDALYSPIILSVSAVLIAVMMTMAAGSGRFQALFGMTVGTAVAVIAYVGKVFDPLQNIGMEIQSIQSAVAGVRRIDAFLSEPLRKQQNSSLHADTLVSRDEASVTLDHVSFSYQDGEPVLQDLSFSLQKGESVTLTGRTGAGKSTVFKLLLGLYSPAAGHVRIFGAEADQIPDSEKRHIFGCVEQTFHQVPGTIADQISLFDPSISEEAVVRAARLTGLHDIIMSFPAGYDTVCQDSLFSQGQWQLLSIARAVAADPPILLLDEITANLDSMTEAAVLAALCRASEHRTVLSISHRLYEKTGGRQIHLDSIQTESKKV